MHDVCRPSEDVRQSIGVENVALDEREVRMLGEIRASERVAVEVVDRDDLVLVDEPPRKRRADEPGAAGDDDPLPGQCHARESSDRWHGREHLAASPRRGVTAVKR